MGVLAFLAEILGITGTVLGIAQTIRGMLLGDQLQKDLVTAEEQVALMYGILTDGTYGLPAIQAEIAGLTPVTLPTTPPAGYGGASSGDIATQVWAYNFPGSTLLAGNSLQDARNYGFQRASNAIVEWAFNPLFWVSGPWLDNFPDFEPAYLPTVDTSSIVLGDTIATWLNREESSRIWTFGGFASGLYSTHYSGTGGSVWFVCKIDAAAMAQIQANLAPSAYALPVWPGLANVTLGTPVALSPALAITAPMDGVLVQSLTPSAPKPTTNFGGVSNYRAVGGLAFVNDDGEAETIQALGFENQVYVPLTMAHASGIIFKCDTTVDATVTPWSLA